MTENGQFSNREQGQTGFALVSVLGFFVLTSFILFAFMESTRLRAATAMTEFLSFRYRLMAEAMVQVVADRVVDGTSRINLNAADDWHVCRLGAHAIFARITDHAGLIDINSASPQLLITGFVTLGLPAGKADMIATAVERYRRFNYQNTDGDSDTLIGPAGYKNAPFEDVIELRDFVDLKSFSAEQLGRVFTVDSRRSAVVSQRAPLALQATVRAQLRDEVPVTVSVPIAQALTVDLEIHRHARLEHSASVIFSLTINDARMKYLPTSVTATRDTHAASLSSECESMFGPAAVAILREVLE